MQNDLLNSKRAKNFDLKIEAFGVNIEICTDSKKLLDKIKKILPEIIPIEMNYAEKLAGRKHLFEIYKPPESKRIKIYKDREEIFEHSMQSRVVEFLSSQIRITVAEFAVSKVFIHAGAVAWKDFGIIIPGQSFSGKTTLVSELIRFGAEYYSDEYAVLDENGFLNPYPKMLSMRGIINDFTQLETPPSEFGAKIGQKKVPVRMVLLSEFQKDAELNLEKMKKGEGIMEILQNTIPIRYNPDFVLKVLKKTVENAAVVKCVRGDAGAAVPELLSYFETVI